MPIDVVSLRFTGGASYARLRELNGFDERSVEDVSTGTAIRLLDRLVMDGPGGLACGAAADLPAADRDRLLVAVYRRAFRDRVDSTARCPGCDHLFDLNFSLSKLAASLETEPGPAIETLPDGTLRTPEGVRLRLPNGRDEMEGAGQPQVLLGRCLLEGEMMPAAVDQLLEQVAPVVDVELDASCPECGRAQLVHFDIQTYLLEALRQDRRRLAWEVHRLATAYGWSWNEILGLSRSERRTYVDLVETEGTRRQRAHA